MNELMQRSLGFYKFYQLGKDRVNIKTRNIDKYEEYFVRYDELGLDLTRKQIKGVLFCKVVFGLSTLLGIYLLADDIQKGVKASQLWGSIFMTLFFAAFLVYSFFVKVDQVFIQGGSKILELNGSSPDKQTVDNFIKNLQTAIRTFYKNKYATIDPTLTEEMQIHNYKWLKELDAITTDEYHELIHELKIRSLFN